MKRIIALLIIYLLFLPLFFHLASGLHVQMELYSLPASALTPDGSTLINRALLTSISSGQTISASPGETLSLTVGYQIWGNVENWDEIDQMLFICSWTPNWPPQSSYYWGIYDGIPSSTSYPGQSGTKQLRITVPTTPGAYYLWLGFCAHYSMAQAASTFTTPLQTPAHAKIVVQGGQPPGNQENTIFSDDFESYAAGTFPSSGGWELVFNGRGNAYQIVSNRYYVSPTRSFRLWGLPNWSAVAQKKFSSSNRYMGYEGSILIESIGTGGPGRVEYFGFYDRAAATWGKWYGTVAFNEDNMKILAEGNIVLGTWTTDTWYKVKVMLDRGTNTYNVWIDGQQKATNLNLNNNDPNIISALALQSDHPGVEVYYDDVRVFESPLTCARFSPMVDGYQFDNNIPKDSVSFWSALNALAGAPWSSSLSIGYLPLYAWFSLIVHNLQPGNCFGMSYTAKYYYENPSLFSMKYPGHGSMFNVGRDVAAPEILATQFPGLETIQPYLLTLLINCLGLNSLDDQIPWIMSQCDNCRVVQLHLEELPNFFHSVLVYDYEMTAKQVTLHIYDPNHHGTTRYLTLSKDEYGHYAIRSGSLIAEYGIVNIGAGDYLATGDALAILADHSSELISVLWNLLSSCGDFLGFKAECPVNIMVTSPNGSKIGFDSSTGSLVNQISGAFYSGNGSDPQIILLPSASPGNYSVQVFGTGSGNYQVTMKSVAPDSTSVSDLVVDGITSYEKLDTIAIQLDIDHTLVQEFPLSIMVLLSLFVATLLAVILSKKERIQPRAKSRASHSHRSIKQRLRLNSESPLLRQRSDD